MNASEREANAPMLNRDGSCHITRTVTTGVSQPLQEVWTSLGEKFAVFDRATAETLMLAEITQRKVKLTIKRTPKGRYVSSAQLFPIGDEQTYICVNCGSLAQRREDGAYSCFLCHFLMVP